MGEIHFFPCDFLFSQVTCFGHDTSRSLKCACKTRPTCFYLGRDRKSCSGQPPSPTEGETDLEAAHSRDPSPASPVQPTPSQRACERGKINVVRSRWVGVGSMQHYWNKSWWGKVRQQKYGNHTNHTDTNSSKNNPFPHRFPKNVFKIIWVALFFPSGLRHCLPIGDEDSS